MEIKTQGTLLIVEQLSRLFERDETGSTAKSNVIDSAITARALERDDRRFDDIAPLPETSIGEAGGVGVASGGHARARNVNGIGG